MRSRTWPSSFTCEGFFTCCLRHEEAKWIKTIVILWAWYLHIFLFFFFYQMWMFKMMYHIMLISSVQHSDSAFNYIAKWSPGYVSNHLSLYNIFTELLTLFLMLYIPFQHILYITGHLDLLMPFTYFKCPFAPSSPQFVLCIYESVSVLFCLFCRFHI